MIKCPKCDYENKFEVLFCEVCNQLLKDTEKLANKNIDRRFQKIFSNKFWEIMVHAKHLF